MDKVKLDPYYYAPDIASLTNEWSSGVQGGEFSGISELNPVFKWMRGFVNAFYGWSNDGKGVMADYLSVVKSINSGWKWCMFKQEDMNSVKRDGKIKLSARDIYNGMVWTYTGKTPYLHVSQRTQKPLLTLDEYHAAIEWVEQHVFVIYPQDRRFKNIKDCFMYMYEVYGIDGFWIDPFKALILDGDERGDFMMTKVFIETKEFALETNSVVNYVSHARSITDVKDKDGRYKVVNQFMQLGGSAWDINMDGQFSIYRPERHKDPNDPRVHFFNLKQRKAEIVGCNRGVYEKIKFDPHRRRYYFDGVDPIDGSVDPAAPKQQSIADFTVPIQKDEVPF